MDLLKREIAPVTAEAWAAIDEEARQTLAVKLAGRKLFDFDGPLGWSHSAVNTGKLDLLAEEIVEGVGAGIRQTQPMIELRAPFHLRLMEIDSISRGMEGADLGPVAEACERVAAAEDSVIFNGYDSGKVAGVLPASEHEPVAVRGDAEERFAGLLRAWQVLQDAGVGGPYGLALGQDLHAALLQASDDGYPVIRRAHELLEGPVVRCDVLAGGALVSTRGGDFRLTVGGDLSIGYTTSDRDQVELYVASSFTFQTLDPAAAIPLTAG